MLASVDLRKIVRNREFFETLPGEVSPSRAIVYSLAYYILLLHIRIIILLIIIQRSVEKGHFSAATLVGLGEELQLVEFVISNFREEVVAQTDTTGRSLVATPRPADDSRSQDHPQVGTM